MKVYSPNALTSFVTGSIAVVCAAVFFTGGHTAQASTNLWTSHGPEGGLIDAVAIDPDTPSTLYAAAHFGGVFKSTDSGNSWSPVRTTGGAHALAIDRSNPTTIYAGGTEGVLKSTDSGGSWNPTRLPAGKYVQALAIDPGTPSTLYAGAFGGGLFKTTDGGGSWMKADTGLLSTVAQTLAIDRTSPSTIYAGTDHGVFKSTNGGGNWSLPTALLTDTVNAVAISPDSPNTLYAGTNFFGVFKSTDSGDSWTVANTGLTDALHPRNVYALAIDSTTSSTLYAGTDLGVFQSTDSGGSWSAANSGLIDHYDSRYVNAVAIDPDTPSTLYAGAGLLGGGVFKSTDSGGSWSAANTGLAATWALTLAVDRSSSSTLYAGTNGNGVFKSTDGGDSWRLRPLLPDTLTDNDMINALAIDPDAPATLYATRGQIFASTDAGDSWSPTQTGFPAFVDAVALVIDHKMPSTLYAGTIMEGLLKSTDSGRSWRPVNTGLPDRHVRVLAIDPSTSNTLYVNAGGFFKSTDGGGTWTFLKVGGAAFAVDPSDGNTLYVGGDGGVFKSTDGGGSWNAPRTPLTTLNGGQPQRETVFALVIDPNTPSTLYAGAVTYDDFAVFKSTDSGDTWNLVGSADHSPATGTWVTALAVDPSGKLYAATQGRGVFDIEQGSGPMGTPTPTSTPVPALCVGDCDGKDSVTVDELLTLVNIALGNALVTSCTAGDANHDHQITIDEILTAVNNALNGCPAGLPSATPTKPAIPTSTMTRTATSMLPASVTPTSTKTKTATSTPLASATPTLGTTQFVDNGDGTITDHSSNLTWEKKDGSGGLHDMNNAYVWAGLCLGDGKTLCQSNANAASACAAATGGALGCAQCGPGLGTCNTFGKTTIWDWLVQLNASSFAGRTDWRIPSVGKDGGATELETILAAQYLHCTSRPCVPAAFNAGCTAGCTVTTCSCTVPSSPAFYWSATTQATSPTSAWLIDFSDAFVFGVNKIVDGGVRAVRGP